MKSTQINLALAWATAEIPGAVAGKAYICPKTVPPALMTDFAIRGVIANGE